MPALAVETGSHRPHRLKHAPAQPVSVIGCCARWATASRRRRSTVLLTIATLVELTTTAILCSRAGAYAGPTTTGTNTSAINGLSFTDIRDSYGVPVWDYLYATKDGSILNPGQTMLATGLRGLEMVFVVESLLALYLTQCVWSFSWLGWFDAALTKVADTLTGQLTTPVILVLSVTIGGLFVAWFVLRGSYAKATLQVVTMVAVATLGTIFLAHPLADVLSPNGVLGQVRNLGFSIVAALNGDDTGNGQATINTVTGTLATNIPRHLLQTWNFDAIVDDSPTCRAAWSNGVLAGSESQVESGLRSCGASSAYAMTQNPSMGQIGTGLVVVTFGTILLMFLAYLSIKVVLCALSAITNGFRLIFALTVGGFIYGRTQLGLVRALVGVAGDAWSMLVYLIYLGGYAMIANDIFEAAPGSGMEVILVGGSGMIAGFVLLRRIDKNLLLGQSQIVDQLQGALTGKPGEAVGSTGGMGMNSLRYSLSPGHLATELALLNANPVTSYVFRRPSPLTYGSKASWDNTWLNYQMMLGKIPKRASESWMARLTANKIAHDHEAREAVREFHGNNARSAAAAVSNVFGLTNDPADAVGALINARYSRSMAYGAVEARARLNLAAEDNPAEYGPLNRAAAAVELARNARHFPDPAERDIYRGQMAEIAALFAYDARPFDPSGFQHLSQADQNFITEVRNHWDEPWETFNASLTQGQGSNQRTMRQRWGEISDDARRYTGSQLADGLSRAATRYWETDNQADLNDAVRWKNRATIIDMIMSDTHVGPWTN
ncbi:hypothetical protein [Nocardia alni]|uniref:hypothetical protein n=1 Tax=Nocardia alni TaxID=2815723 RepID=UPI001C21CD63|nr:hypothetical protein [Nocardia alni]